MLEGSRERVFVRATKKRVRAVKHKNVKSVHHMRTIVKKRGGELMISMI